MTRLTLLLTVLILFLTGCHRKEETLVPRRTAYPRVELYDTIYKEAISSPVKVWVNSSATTEVSRRNENDTWINVRYPRYRATLSLTLIEATGENLKKALDNRNERISLNLHGVECSTTGTSYKDVTGIIPVAERPCVTPVQVLATDKSSFLLTGALTFDGDTSRDTEEIAPAVNAVKNDLLYMINHLKQ